MVLLLPLAGCGSSTAQDQLQPAAAATTPAPDSRVPPEFRHACGKPGSTVDVRNAPVTVRQAACDLTGVTLELDGIGTYVPAPGEGVSAIGDAVLGSTSGSLRVERDARTGDVTVTG